jgi:thiamine phosphate synthase YjbQ (UPF0047 family)
MKAYPEYLTFNIPARMGLVNITSQVEEIVKKSGVAEGICALQRDEYYSQYLHQRR